MLVKLSPYYHSQLCEGEQRRLGMRKNEKAAIEDVLVSREEVEGRQQPLLLIDFHTLRSFLWVSLHDMTRSINSIIHPFFSLLAEESLFLSQ